jgi:hypothetical protein
MIKFGIFVFFFFFLTPAFAEILVLKSGQNVTGKITGQDKKSIKLNIDGVELTYFNEDIDRVEVSILKQKESQVSPVKSISESKGGQGEEDGLTIAINPLVELDFKTKSEVYELRKGYVRQYPELAIPGYRPSEQIFGQIEDKKGWWGISGISCYGPGEKGIEGLSEESRFLVNPYLLVGVVENNAHIVSKDGSYCSANYPKATKVFWHRSHYWAKATYNVSDYIAVAKQYRYSDPNALYLVAYNARDYGFNYFCIDLDKTVGVDESNFSREPLPLNQFIHCGGSCGYAGGCNNASPTEGHMVINVVSLPAWVYVKLWKAAPVAATQDADMIFIVELQ